MSAPEKFRLTAHERESQLWRRLKAHLVERLQAERAANDHTSTDELTAWRRGRIATLKYLVKDLELPADNTSTSERAS